MGSSLINDNEPIINNSLSIHKLLRFPMLLKRFAANSRNIILYQDVVPLGVPPPTPPHLLERHTTLVGGGGGGIVVFHPKR